MTRTQWRGRTFDTRTADMLAELARRLEPAQHVTPVQGSYSRGVHASGGTHDGGGAVDLSVDGLTDTAAWALANTARTLGFAAWYRTPIPKVWGRHVHMIAVGCPDLSPAAASQVRAYHQGLDGLAGHGHDPGDRRYTNTTWETYRLATAAIMQTPTATLTEEDDVTPEQWQFIQSAHAQNMSNQAQILQALRGISEVVGEQRDEVFVQATAQATAKLLRP